MPIFDDERTKISFYQYENNYRIDMYRKLNEAGQFEGNPQWREQCERDVIEAAGLMTIAIVEANFITEIFVLRIANTIFKIQDSDASIIQKLELLSEIRDIALVQKPSSQIKQMLKFLMRSTNGY